MSVKRLARCANNKCEDGGVEYYTTLEDAVSVMRKTKGSLLGFLVIIPPYVEQLENLRDQSRASLHVLAERYGRRCLVCDSTDDLLVDHIISLSRGGDSEIENLQILCRVCNFRKGLKIIDYRPFPFERGIDYCRGCQKIRFTPFTPMYWMSEFVEVCPECLPEWEGSEAVINPSQAFAPNYLT